jgi:glycosyltransferase involved in cell wall biosynthesis
MRIAMVSEHASPLAVLGGVDAGGQNVHVAALAMAMARRGHTIAVYTRRDDPGLPDGVAMAPRVVVEHVDAGPPGPLPKDELLPYMDAFAAHLSRAWLSSRPDLVHAHFWMSGKAALEAARPFRVPVVQTFHALGVVKRRHQGVKDTSPPRRLGIETAIIQQADHIIATCTDEVFELVRLGADRNLISIVPCGVDLARFRPDGPAESRPRDRHRLVVVSRLVERKGIADAIEALALIPDAELVVAGGPPRERLAQDPEGARLISIAHAAGVADRVDFRGAVDRNDVPCLIRSADLVVCVPWYEPFGIVPVEAMACGVPVVASAVGGLIDTVVDGVTGVHVPAREPARLAQAVRGLLEDPARRAALGAAGAWRARQRYGHDQVAASTLDCYRRLLGGDAVAERAAP